MQIDMNRFRAAFYEEAGEHLENMEGALLQLESDSSDSELLNTIFRAAHSIKGASSTFGIETVAKFTHVLENLLDRLRDGEIKVTPDLIQLLLTSTDVLTALVQAEKNQTQAPENMANVLAELNKFSDIAPSPEHYDSTAADQSAAATNSSVATIYEIEFIPSESFFLFGQNPLYLLADLKGLSTKYEAEANATRLPPLSEINPEHCYLSWRIRLETSEPANAVDDVFMFVDDETKYTVTAIATAAATVAETEVVEPTQPAEPLDGEDSNSNQERRNSVVEAPRETVRVDRERLDTMINQIGELVIGTSMVEQDWSSVQPDTESCALVQLGKIVRDLQEMSLSLRMVPIAGSFQKLTRVVRDLSLKLGKQIHLETEGEDTELDKTVVDQIGDPLLHMIRNSVDHGIEMPEDRIAAGKPAEGTVHLRAFHQGGNFIIEIEDDGKGLDRDSLLKKAIDRGIVSAADNLSDDEIYGLIFAAGFSTADAVTDVSGRGVGMDVVRRNVEALQGSISIRSELGKGCRMTVRLPLTLAILDGLLVRVANDSYVVPLLSVVESIKPASSEIQSVMGKGEVITLRGEVVPLLRLECMLNHQRPEDRREAPLLVIVEDQGRKYAMVVDELLGQQQVVIKNLEANFQKVPGIAGATILGDGRVALILDINGLSSLSAKSTTHQVTSAFTAQALAVLAEAEAVCEGVSVTDSTTEYDPASQPTDNQEECSADRQGSPESW